MGEILLLEPRAVVAHRQHAALQQDLDRVVGPAPLARVVDDVGDRAGDPLGRVDDHRRLEIEAELELRRSALGVVDRPSDDRVELDRFGVLVGRRSAGELDDVGDELCELVELGDDRLLEALAILLGQAVGLQEDLDVAA